MSPNAWDVVCPAHLDSCSCSLAERKSSKWKQPKLSSIWIGAPWYWAILSCFISFPFLSLKLNGVLILLCPLFKMARDDCNTTASSWGFRGELDTGDHPLSLLILEMKLWKPTTGSQRKSRDQNPAVSVFIASPNLGPGLLGMVTFNKTEEKEEREKKPNYLTKVEILFCSNCRQTFFCRS